MDLLFLPDFLIRLILDAYIAETWVHLLVLGWLCDKMKIIEWAGLSGQIMIKVIEVC